MQFFLFYLLILENSRNAEGLKFGNFQFANFSISLGDQWDLNPRPPGPHPGVLTN